MEKRWSKAEVTYLKRHAGKRSAEELAQKFHTDVKTVTLKLDKLGLGAAGAGAAADADAAIDDYRKALELLYKKSWKKASTLLEKVAANASDIQLADRARQHQAVCQRNLEKAAKDGDPYLEAVFEKNRGNFEEALALCDTPKAKKEERYAYLLASIRALAGDEDAALEHLATAIKLEPKNRVHAFHDPDFEGLQEREEFAELVQAP